MASTRILTSAALRSLPLAAAAAWGGLHLTQSPVSCDAPPTMAKAAKPKPKTFREATCVSNTQHTHNTRLVKLKLPADWNTDRTPVANVLVRAYEIEEKDTESGETVTSKKAVIRPYNPLSAKSGDEITLLVKKYGDDAKMGSYLHELAAGESISVKGPNMQWSLPDAGAVERYAFVAGGTGITPVIQAAEGILRKDLEAKVDILTFNDTPHDVLLRRELMDLIVTYGGRLRVQNFWGMLNEGLEADGELVQKMPAQFGATLARNLAYPTRELLEKALPKADDCDGHIMVVVCGPGGMVAKVAGSKTKDYKQGELGGILSELGFEKGQVWKL